MRIPHTGGLRIKPGTPEEAVLKSWIQTLSSLSGDELARALDYSDQPAKGDVASAVVLRRLTHSQYNNTVHDLLGDQTSPADQFPPEDLRKRIQRPVRRTESFAAAGRSIQQRRRKAGPRRVSRRRHQRAGPLQSVGRSAATNSSAVSAFARFAGRSKPAEEKRYRPCSRRKPIS